MGLFPVGDSEFDRVVAVESATIDAAQAIAEALDASGISRAELARRLGVSRSEITARLRGERNISVRKLAETVCELGAELEIGVRFPASEDVEEREIRDWRRPRDLHEHVVDVERVVDVDAAFRLVTAHD